jgi:hypothetical protein
VLEIADRNGEPAAAAIYRDVADRWQGAVEGWTRTSNGPLSDQPYYLRLTVDGNADAGTTYTIGDGGPTIDQRRVVDTSFLELVRLGVKPADDRDIRATLPVVDRELGVDTPSVWLLRAIGDARRPVRGIPDRRRGHRASTWDLPETQWICLNGEDPDDPDGTNDISDGFCGRVVDPARATVLATAHRRHRVPGTRPQWRLTLDGRQSGNRHRRTRAALRRRRT